MNLLVVLPALLILGCNHSVNRKMESQPATELTETSGIISGYAPVNGLRMYYEIHGNGKPLVLIHGGGSTLQTTFGNVLVELAKSHRVIAVEMQAHGHTADIDRPLSFQQDADDISELLKFLKIPQAAIFGFSNGASTTLQFAIRYPEMTRKIIVASAFYKRDGAPDWFWGMMEKASFDGMPQPYKQAFLKINPDTVALHRMYERDLARMQSFPDITDREMKSIKAPALIIIGDRDVVTPGHAVEMHGLLSGSRLAILPGGHGDYIGELSAPYDSSLVTATVGMINKFLMEAAPE
jgi:pimeloyl-ACP methyl ester carboxylesterase